ncbi:MAG TPA: WG repeat-containing protein [Chryseolinea sp.]
MRHDLNAQFLFLLIFVVTSSGFSQDQLPNFLRSLRQSSLDSTTEVTQYHAPGVVKQRFIVMHSHYFAFDIDKEKFLRKTFIGVTKHYGKNGALQKCDSLTPPEQGHYYEKYYAMDGAISRIVTYRVRTGSAGGVAINLPQQNLLRIKEVSFDKAGKETVIYTEPPKYVVEKTGDYFDLTDKVLEDISLEHVNTKYATFEDKGKYLEIQIRDASSDSMHCRLQLDYSNDLLKTNEQSAVRAFLAAYVKIFTDVPRLVIFDAVTSEYFILNYDFKKIFKNSVRDVRLLRPASSDKHYFWLCHELCGLYDINGKNIIPEKNKIVYPDGDFLKVTTDGAYACFDYNGKMVIPYTNDFDAFNLSDANIALIYNTDFSEEKREVTYTNLHTKETFKFTSGMPFQGDFAVARDGRAWGVIDKRGKWVIKPDARIKHVEITPDSLLFLTLDNSKFYARTSEDRKYWYEKYVLQLPESMQHKTDLLVRHPDFDPREQIYVLYNIKNGTGDTIKINPKLLDGIFSYNLYIESFDNVFINGFAPLKITGHAKDLNWLYTLLCADGSVVDITKRYNAVGNMSKKGFAVVTKKEIVDGSRTKEFQGIIDTTGKEVIPCNYSSCRENKYGFVIFGKKGWGFADFDGEILIASVHPYQAVEWMIKKSVNPFIPPLGAPSK